MMLADDIAGQWAFDEVKLVFLDDAFVPKVCLLILFL